MARTTLEMRPVVKNGMRFAGRILDKEEFIVDAWSEFWRRGGSVCIGSHGVLLSYRATFSCVDYLRLMFHFILTSLKSHVLKGLRGSFAVVQLTANTFSS